MMKKEISLTYLQWIIWSILLAIHILSLLPYDSVSQSVAYSVIYVSFYLLIIYGNAYFLLPRLYEKGNKKWYVTIIIILIPLIAFIRTWITFYVYNKFYAEKPTMFRIQSVTSSLITVVLVYISSILFYMALNFFRLRSQQEQLQKRQAESELNLLKAQVQPHFLFNTLNNIYFVAQRESPATAVLLEQLSQIMRYFVDEAPKDTISLQAEIDFIKNYIALEKMRMRYPLQVNIQEDGIDGNIQVPPMLLIPLVENVFKHGIDKLRNDNFITLHLRSDNHRLLVTVENLLIQPSVSTAKSETGLRNLRSRMDILFGSDYTLVAGDTKNIFKARINIPL